jgi:membrane protease YdiL (CAAX protease family)
VLLVLALALAPALGEELAFRGPLMGGLRGRLPGRFVIGFVALAFAARHLDLQHVVAVAPNALWFTLVAWYTRSLWASMACHFANSLTAAILTSLGVASSEHMDWWVHGLARCAGLRGGELVPARP